MAPISPLLPQYLGLAAIGSLCLASYIIAVFTYRIWFSPLSHIPGPRLAAATRWYEFYFDAVKIGKYYLEIERMHRIYGTYLFSVAVQACSGIHTHGCGRTNRQNNAV
jgi:hypothetical protein